MLKGQLISEWIYDLIVSPKIWTKNCQDFCPPYTGQKSWQFFICILGETMTSKIHSEIDWPLVVKIWWNEGMERRGLNHFLHLNEIKLCTRGQNLEFVLDLNFSLTIQTLTTDEKCILTSYHTFYQSYQQSHQRQQNSDCQRHFSVL